jgi:hypothetical protein
MAGAKEHGLVDQQIEFLLKGLFGFVEFVKGLYFLFLDAVDALLKFQQLFHIEGAFLGELTQKGDILNKSGYLFEGVLLEQLEVEFSAVDQGVQIEAVQFLGCFLDRFKQQGQGRQLLQLVFQIVVDETEFWLLAGVPSSSII